MKLSGPRVLGKRRRFVRTHSQIVLISVPWKARKSRSQAEKLLSCARLLCRRRALSYVLLAIGGSLCTYVTGNYVWMFAQQQKLLRQWRKNDSLASAHPLTKLSIPTIHLEAVVLEGASQHSLLEGPAHLAEASL